MQQIFKDIVGYEGLYQVSNLGNVKSLNYRRTGKKKLMKHRIAKTECKNRIYKAHIVLLYKQGRAKQFLVHRLVYEAFNGLISNGFQIDHIDNNPQNNRLDNLQLLTHSENNKKKFDDNPNYKSNLGLRPKKILCLTNNTIYESIMEAERQLGVYHQNVQLVLKGKFKQTHGYTFQYV